MTVITITSRTENAEDPATYDYAIEYQAPADQTATWTPEQVAARIAKVTTNLALANSAVTQYTAELALLNDIQDAIEAYV